MVTTWHREASSIDSRCHSHFDHQTLLLELNIIPGFDFIQDLPKDYQHSIQDFQYHISPAQVQNLPLGNGEICKRQVRQGFMST